MTTLLRERARDILLRYVMLLRVSIDAIHALLCAYETMLY